MFLSFNFVSFTLRIHCSFLILFDLAEKKGGGGQKTFEKESIKRQAHNLQFFSYNTFVLFTLGLHGAL